VRWYSRLAVVDHDAGRLVWAAAGRDRKTVKAFLKQLSGFFEPGRP
jgi:hypothetical protein